jgi:hypothetical protein
MANPASQTINAMLVQPNKNTFPASKSWRRRCANYPPLATVGQRWKNVGRQENYWREKMIEALGIIFSFAIIILFFYAIFALYQEIL